MPCLDTIDEQGEYTSSPKEQVDIEMQEMGEPPKTPIYTTSPSFTTTRSVYKLVSLVVHYGSHVRI